MEKKVALVTGGSSGLGYEIARVLATDCDVIITSTDEEKLKKAAGEIGCDLEVFDVSDNLGVEKAVTHIIKKHKRIDYLVNNAGIWIEGKLEENDPDRIREVMEVNALGPIFLSRAVIPYMKKQGEGTIMNVISQAGLYGRDERSVYNSSKFAVTGFTKSLEMELKKHGIRVIGLYPGFMKTKLFEKAKVPAKDMQNALDPKEVARTVKFILESGPDVEFPEIGIKNVRS